MRVGDLRADPRRGLLGTAGVPRADRDRPPRRRQPQGKSEPQRPGAPDDRNGVGRAHRPEAIGPLAQWARCRRERRPRHDVSMPDDPVRIREVGPRDGFQNEPETIPTADKVRLVEGLARTGLRRLEVTSFVRADVIPQLADGPEVLRAADDPRRGRRVRPDPERARARARARAS